MNELNIQIRDATLADAHALAELINYAGEGLPLYLWERMTQPGENAWDVGRRRAKREEGSFSYRNTLIAERDETIMACLIGYPLAAVPEPIDYEAMPAMFVPLQELEDLAPDTWYVNVLAVYPEYRGRGIGSRLLDVAEQLALQADKGGLSIIVSDANSDAQRLYERKGYSQTAKRPMVKEQWHNAGQSWVLLTRYELNAG
jgi:ribosomal protein S18 acetylase RimI-like enzyme